MVTPTRFNGMVVLRSDYAAEGDFRGPKAVDLTFDATFDSGGTWQVACATFGGAGHVEVPDIATSGHGLRTLRASLADDARGRFDCATGSISLSATFDFEIGGQTSTLRLELGTAESRLTAAGGRFSGAALDCASPWLRLAGLGRFVGGYLDGAQCLVQLDGRFEPKPWA